MGRRLRIAQIAPLMESVPPRWYGGTERVVSYLTEELVALGHEVTLFASGDSRTEAHLWAPCPRALRLDPDSRDSVAPHVVMLEELARQGASFDLVHSHVDYLAYSILRRMATPSVTTLHGRLDLPELEVMYREFADISLVSISKSQRSPLPRARWVGCVPHGLPADLYQYRETAGAYLAYVGRISPEKRIDDAIRIACRADVPLRIAAKLDGVDRAYFEAVVHPLLDDPRIELVGEIGDSDKQDFLGGAMALLFPIDWPEPFGLVMAEALACGTPVIARRRGAVPEVVEHGVTGYVVDTNDEAVAAVLALDQISRADCRRVFEERFTASRMAENYVQLYERQIGGGLAALAARGGT